MNTNMIGERLPKRRRNLEIYSIAIFSEYLGSSDDFKLKLQQMIDYIAVLESEVDMQTYMKENKYDSIIFIVSVELGEIIIKSIHDLKQLYQIYVYNPTNTVAQWTNDYQKIQAVVNNSNTLIDILSTNFKAKTIRQESFLKFYELTIEIWYLSFIRLLIKLNHENNDRQPLTDYLKNYYAENETNLECVRKFEREYSSSNVLYWYTRDCFLYSLLNKAFRSHDYKLLILFRFFIADLHEQLCGLYNQQNISTDAVYYRGQRMYNDEIEALGKNQLVCCSSFFSTTYNLTLASEFFAGASPSPSSSIDQAVLFVIRSSSFSYKQLRFADISSFSNIDTEQEVLFTVGSYFRIENKWFDTEKNLWTIELHEMPVRENKEHFHRPFYMDIITIGFYLLMTDDDFQSVHTYYDVLLKQANTALWCIGCRVGLGLIEYYKKNYDNALKEFWTAIDRIDKENLRETCEIIENIYCILANVYREMNDYDMALVFYTDARKGRREMNYFVEKTQNSFSNQFIYTKKFNPFVKSDKFFYFCDRPQLNTVLLYKRTEQWTLARELFQKVLQNYTECKKNGEVEMIIKVLSYQDENWHLNDFINKNRSFLGGKTLAIWLDNRHKNYIIYAYEQLALYYLKHNCPDYAYLCYQEILDGEIELESSSKIGYFRGIGDVYAMKQDYSMAINWFKQAIDIDIKSKDLSTFESITIQLYKEILSIYNEKLNDPLSMIAYMKEIIDIVVERTDRLDQVNFLIVTIYKLTVYFYHSTGDESKIVLICNHIEEILDILKIDDQSWRRWLCILSKCDINRFKEIYHDCDPITDQNYNVYLKFYDKMYHLLCNNTTGQFKTEIIKRCDYFRNVLKVVKYSRICEIFELWKTTNAPMNNHLNLTRSLSYPSFFMPIIEHDSTSN